MNVLHYTVFKLTPLPDNIQREEDISYKNLDIIRAAFEIVFLDSFRLSSMIRNLVSSFFSAFFDCFLFLSISNRSKANADKLFFETNIKVLVFVYLNIND